MNLLIGPVNTLLVFRANAKAGTRQALAHAACRRAGASLLRINPANIWARLIDRSHIYQAIVLAGLMLSQAAFAAPCVQGDKTHIWISPRVVKPETPINVMAVSTSQAITELVLTNPEGEKFSLKATTNDGIPWHLSAQIDSLDEGHYRLEVKYKDESLGCREIFNGDNGPENHAAWNDNDEAFYSAWIEQLFDNPADENLSFPSLEPNRRS